MRRETSAAGNAASAPAAESPRGPAEQAFDEGWTALRAGQYGPAAAAFGRAAAAPGPGGAALAEDAAYWRVVALARGERGAEAEQEMALFLQRHPRSSRAGEVSAMLGWALLRRGEVAAARRRFDAAAADRSQKVRQSAADGLRAIEAMGAQKGRDQ